MRGADVKLPHPSFGNQFSRMLFVDPAASHHHDTSRRLLDQKRDQFSSRPGALFGTGREHAIDAEFNQCFQGLALVATEVERTVERELHRPGVRTKLCHSRAIHFTIGSQCTDHRTRCSEITGMGEIGAGHSEFITIVDKTAAARPHDWKDRNREPLEREAERAVTRRGSGIGEIGA